MRQEGIELADGTWSSVDDLRSQIVAKLGEGHDGSVSWLEVELEGDTVVLRGQVTNEDCKADAKLIALTFDGVFKVRNLVVVAGHLEAASDNLDGYMSGGFMAEPAVVVGSKKRGTILSSISRASKDAFRRLRNKTLDESDASNPTVGAERVEVTRVPSIEADRLVSSGQSFELTVDLLTDESADVGVLSLGSFPADWQEIQITVQVHAAWITDIEVVEDVVELRSDGTSKPAKFRCVAGDLPEDMSADVHVTFSHGTRVCGHAVRTVEKEVMEAVEESAESGNTNSQRSKASNFVLDPNASGPTLAVTIIADASGRQHWHWAALVCGSREQGRGTINLSGNSAAEFAEKLLNECPQREGQDFKRFMAGIGETLWKRSPTEFRSFYLDLRSKLGSGFTIQFDSDDPYIPWEMMKPTEADHLYFDHPVARWPLTAPKKWGRLPVGRICSFVPKYSDGRNLLHATAEGAWLQSNLHSVSMNATKDEFLGLLESANEEDVALVHFAGHGIAETGNFDGGIALEDGNVVIMEVRRSAVTLGERLGSLVFLNACDTSSSASLLGMVTGWGEALASRSFGGLVAPLWAVSDDVASKMLQVSLPSLLSGHATLGEAVRDARTANKSESISAFAYLAHGDVMARFTTRL